jgi:ribokinase
VNDRPPRRLLGVASVLVDVSLRVPRLPGRGGDVVAEDAGRAAGGGLNALAAAARLGLPAAYGGPHGTGANGDTVRAALAADGVDAVLPPRTDGDTGWCLALLEPDGERTFVTVPGVEARPRAADLTALPLRPRDHVYVSGYDLAYPDAGPVLAAWVAGLSPPAPLGGPVVVLDPGPLVAEIPAALLEAVLARTDVLTVSRAEAVALGLSGACGPDDAGPRPRRLPPTVRVVLRLGADGAVLRTRGVATRVPGASPPGPVVDTNGAGDVHTGAFLAASAAGLDPVAALRLANRAAAWSVTVPGADSGPTWRQLGLPGPLRPVLPGDAPPQDDEDAAAGADAAGDAGS